MFLKEKVVVTNELREIDRDRLVNRSKLCQEVGRTLYSQIDQFCLTRKLNHPELVFNQRLLDD